SRATRSSGVLKAPGPAEAWPWAVTWFVCGRTGSMSFPRSAWVRSFVRPAVVAALVALAATGCGGRGDVSGKVTYKGKPLVGGTVQFEACDNVLKQGNINGDGTYSLRGVA